MLGQQEQTDSLFSYASTEERILKAHALRRWSSICSWVSTSLPTPFLSANFPLLAIYLPALQAGKPNPTQAPCLDAKQTHRIISKPLARCPESNETSI